MASTSLHAYWTEVKNPPGGPAARSSHAIAVIGGKVYLFGGEEKPRVPVDNTLYVLDLKAGSWSHIGPSAGAPSPRIGVTMVAHGTSLYIFGGRSAEATELNELYRFDTSSSTWTLLPSGANSPPARSYHAMAPAPKHNKIFVFGGCGKDGRLNDLWAYDIGTGKWSAQPSPGPSCPPRGGPGLAVANNSVWVVFGFDGTRELGDVHRFDLGTKAWEHVEAFQGTLRKAITPRSVFGMVTWNGNDENIILFGGETAPSSQGHAGAGTFSDDLYILGTRPVSWIWPTAHVTMGTASAPGARAWFPVAATEDGMVMYGGTSPANTRLNDIYQLVIADINPSTDGLDSANCLCDMLSRYFSP